MRGWLLVGLLITVPAHAQVMAPEPIELVYSAPAGCPEVDTFFAGIRARANAVRAARAERRFVVTITGDEAPRGTLVVTAADGTTTTRDVVGATCAETTAALTLVAALAIEERLVREPPRPAVVVPSSAWGVAVGAGIGVYGGVAPSVALGVPLYVAASHDHARFRIGIARTEHVDAAMPVGSVDFQWTVGRADSCPYVVTAGRFAVAPCIGFEAGVLRGRGTQVAVPTSDSRPWLAPDAMLRLAVRLGRASLELEGGLAAPLVRDRFFIAPDTTVHRVPALTTGANASLAIDLW